MRLLNKTLDQCKKSDAVLLACVGDIKYDSLARELRPESGLLKLRSALNLFANIRPVKIRKSLLDASTLKKEIVEHVDLIVVRELIGGIYFGKPRGQIKKYVLLINQTFLRLVNCGEIQF